MRWPYQTKGLQINVRSVDNENGVIILHVKNWEEYHLGWKKDEVE